MGDGGKGSAPRPFSVSNQEYAERWDAIFGRDKDKKEPVQPLPQTIAQNIEEYQKDQASK